MPRSCWASRRGTPGSRPRSPISTSPRRRRASPERADSAGFGLLLHARARPSGVGDIAELLESADLRLVTFIEPDSYDPDFYVKDATLSRRLAGLSAIERAAIAELVAGNLPRHAF